MVNYRLRDEIRELTVCLYEPGKEEPFTFDKLWNFIQDCAYQIVNGLPVRRMPFHLATCPADAEQAVADMRKALSDLRQAKKEDEKQKSGADEGFVATWPPVRRKQPPGGNADGEQPRVTPVDTAKAKKGVTRKTPTRKKV